MPAETSGEPLVSVIIPTYRRAAFLRRAIVWFRNGNGRGEPRPEERVHSIARDGAPRSSCSTASRRFYRVHLNCARRCFAANEIETARHHFFKTWAGSPAQVSSLAYGLACFPGRASVWTHRALFRPAGD